ncbi:MAG: hypothetical protein OEL84_04370 [Nitrosopumilus sp.]|nr:hypothetical protein [Nitrosopumilus sp.]MDH3340507.1 hypothetical protein [Nitrosopumilus sp.]
MKKKILDSLQSFFQTIHEISLGFAVKKGYNIVFAHNKNQIFSYTLKNDESNDIEGRFLDISGVDVTSCPLDENNDEIVFVLGEQEYLPEEYELLKFLMEQVKIIPDNDVISSIVGNTLSKESIESLLSPKNHFKTSYSISQNEDESKFTIQLPKELAEKLDEFILTKLDLKTFEFTKSDPEKIKSLIVSSLVKQFLSSTFTYQAEDITGKDVIDITFMSNFPKCNICRSFSCEHIDIILNDKPILSDLKKDGIIPIQIDFTELQDEIETTTDKEIDVKNKSKSKKNEN